MSLDAEFSEDFCDEETSSATVEKEDQVAEIESDKESMARRKKKTELLLCYSDHTLLTRCCGGWCNLCLLKQI